jgi:ribonuclease P protein component
VETLQADTQKPDSLSRQVDFRRIYSQGKRYRTPLLTAVIFRPSEGDSGLRIAWVVSRKVAKHAVDRNRTRRRMREAFRSLTVPVSGALDIVLIAHPGLPRPITGVCGRP